MDLVVLSHKRQDDLPAVPEGKNEPRTVLFQTIWVLGPVDDDFRREGSEFQVSPDDRGHQIQRNPIEPIFHCSAPCGAMHPGNLYTAGLKSGVSETSWGVTIIDSGDPHVQLSGCYR